jgi:hypothetical protein
MTLVLRPQLESALEPARQKGVSFRPALTTAMGQQRGVTVARLVG